MPVRSDDVPLWDLHRALQQLVRLVDEHSEESFLDDEDAIAAAAMYLLLVGESANKLSQAAKAGVADSTWRKVVDLRHRLAHGYFRQDPRRLWEAAVDHAPILQRSLPPVPPVDAD